MIGVTEITAIFGMLLGLVIGFQRSLHHGWLVVLSSCVGGAIAGLICGIIWALLVDWSTKSLHDVSQRIAVRHPVFADIVFWLGAILTFVVFLLPLIYLSRASPRVRH